MRTPKNRPARLAILVALPRIVVICVALSSAAAAKVDAFLAQRHLNAAPAVSQ
jgi:hypothetical protein